MKKSFNRVNKSNVEANPPAVSPGAQGSKSEQITRRRWGLTTRSAYQQRLIQMEWELTELRSRIDELESRARELEQARDYYGALFREAPVGYLVLDEVGLVHEHNQQIAAMLGLPRAEDLRGPFVRFIAKKNISKFLAHLHECKTASEPMSSDIALRTPNGKAIPVEIISTPLDSMESAGMKCFRTALVNISQKRVLEEALERTQHDFQTLVETVEGIVWEADARTLDVTFISRSAGQILGYPPGAWYQKGFWESHIHVDDREGVVNAMARLLQNGKSATVEFRMTAADRRLVWLHTTITLRELEHGARLFGVGVDITQRKSAEEELQKAQAELEKRIEERTGKLRETISDLEAFSYSLSHDMRAPLRAMQGYAEILLSELAEKIGPAERDYFERIMRSAQRLDRLIQDVLQYTNIARAPLELEPLNLEELVDTLVHEYPSFQEPNAEIEVQRPLLPVLGHEAFLSQTISNLLTNAVKFVPRGQKPKVRIRSQRIDSEVRIWVEDNGIGIKAEHQKRLFSIFQRVHVGSIYEGTGIGLAIVQKAVERMGGSVGVESEEGKGSKFWLQLQRTKD